MLFSILKIQELEFLLQTLKIIIIRVISPLSPTGVKRKICTDYSVATSTVILNLSLQELPHAISLKIYYFPSFQVRAQANQVDQLNCISKYWLPWGGYLCSNPHSSLGEKSHYIYNKIVLFAPQTLFHYRKDKQRWKMGLALLFWYGVQSVLNIYFKSEKAQYTTISILLVIR